MKNVKLHVLSTLSLFLELGIIEYILIKRFIHSYGVCRIRRFLAVFRSLFHSSLSSTFSCHPSPPTILPSSLTSSCHLFLGLPLNLVVPKFVFNALFGILFSLYQLDIWVPGVQPYQRQYLLHTQEGHSSSYKKF